MHAPSTSPATSSACPQQRIFFALWPSGADAERIMAWARDAHKACGGRMMRVDTLHLTLAFLGSTPVECVQALVRAVPSWPALVAPVTLRRFGRFTGPRIVWAGPEEDDSRAWLDSLHDDLWRRLQALGWQRPNSHFRPHVSLLRKAGPGELNVLHRPPLAWMPDQCVLVASQPTEGGSTYRILAGMPLRRL